MNPDRARFPSILKRIEVSASKTFSSVVSRLGRQLCCDVNVDDSRTPTIPITISALPKFDSTPLFVSYRRGIGESTKVAQGVSMQLSPWRIGDFSPGGRLSPDAYYPLLAKR